MRLNQAGRGPLVVFLGDAPLSIPRFTLRDFIAWGAELDATRLNQITDGLKPKERAEYLSFYQVLPYNLSEIRRMAPTPAGVLRICTACLARATLAGVPFPAEQVPALIESNGPDVLEALAARLALMADDDAPAPANDEEAGADQSPLPGSPGVATDAGTAESNPSQPTTPAS